MLKPLIYRCEAAWRVALEEIGLQRKYGRFRMDVNDEVLGRIGLNRVAHRATRRVEVNVVAGVSHVPLELKVAELRSREPRKRYAVPATISRHLGYLTPRGRYTPWWFSEDTDVEAVAREMAAWVEKYAFPFYQEHQTLRDFYESMRTRRYGGITQDHAYRVPLAALMLGMSDAARQHLTEYAAKIEAQAEGHPAYRVPIRREVGVAFLIARPGNRQIVDEYLEYTERLLRLIDECGSPA